MILPESEFKKIHDVITECLNAYNEDVSRSCRLYAVIGAYLLKRHYSHIGKELSIEIGIAMIVLDDEHNMLLFGHKDKKGVVAKGELYHAWVRVDDWLIDFASPHFNRIGYRDDTKPDHTMVQSSVKDMATSPYYRGDFFYHCVPKFHNQRIKEIISDKGFNFLLGMADGIFCERHGIEKKWQAFF